MMYFLLKTGSSDGAVPTCQSPCRDRLDGHKAMIDNFGVSILAD
jgi:hypothetical protein